MSHEDNDQYHTPDPNEKWEGFYFSESTLRGVSKYILWAMVVPAALAALLAFSQSGSLKEAWETFNK